jgi:hypothetical protein
MHGAKALAPATWNNEKTCIKWLGNVRGSSVRWSGCSWVHPNRSCVLASNQIQGIILQIQGITPQGFQDHLITLYTMSSRLPTRHVVMHRPHFCITQRALTDLFHDCMIA